MSEQREEYTTDELAPYHIGKNLDPYITTTLVNPITKDYYLALLNLVDTVREATRPPYPDSDPASLLETIQTRLREALDLIDYTSP